MEAPRINPARLRLARTELGLTLEAVASKSGLGQSSLSEFENGVREPRIAQLAALAGVYRRSIAWFFDATIPARPVVLWRDRPTDAVRAAVEAEFLQLCTYYRNLEVWCGEVLSCTLPIAGGDATAYDYADAECLAVEVRKFLDLGDQPAFALLTALEERVGVRVFRVDAAPSGTAACSVDEQLGYAVMLNGKSAPWRRNFDLAHELFHLLTWNLFHSAATVEQVPLRSEESLANAFASTLLMPEEPFRGAIREATRMGGALHHRDFFDIARRFGVSFEAVLWRLHRLFSRREDETKRDIEVCRSLRASFEDRSTAEEALPARPERFRSLAIRALQQGEISIGRAAEYLGISRQQAIELERLSDVDDDEVALSRP